MSKQRIRERARGVTFIEFLVVIGADALIIILVITALSRAYHAALAVQCRQNLKNIGTSIKEYESLNLCLPPMTENRMVPPQSGTYAKVSFFYQLLPYVELDSFTYKKYPEAAALKAPIYLCPSDPTAGAATPKGAYSNYAANFAVFRGQVNPTMTPPVNMKVSTSQAMPASSTTIVMGERLQDCNGTATLWAVPGPASYFHVVYTDKMTGLPAQPPPPPGMHIQLGVTNTECRPYNTRKGPDDTGWDTSTNQSTNPTGSTFQTVHPGAMNVLRGDGMVSQLSSGFDPRSLNFYCVGIGRDIWGVPMGQSYEQFP